MQANGEVVEGRWPELNEHALSLHEAIEQLQEAMRAADRAWTERGRISQVANLGPLAPGERAASHPTYADGVTVKTWPRN